MATRESRNWPRIGLSLLVGLVLVGNLTFMQGRATTAVSAARNGAPRLHSDVGSDWLAEARLSSESVQEEWQATPISGPPTPGRTAHSAVWTGQELIIWGGQGRTNSNDGRAHNTGAAYTPSIDSWINIAPAGSIPLGRMSHSTVWTGAEMIVWGGTDYSLMTLDTGARYHRATDQWRQVTTVNAPISRWGHSAVWTGDKMIVWGGYHMVVTSIRALDDGAAYDPISDAWQALPNTSLLTARQEHTAIWTGTEMIVWGGRDANTFFASGARYSPITNSWSPVSTVGAPSARSGHAAVWTGSEMIVWGGRNGSMTLFDGARYNPTLDRWQALPAHTVPVPSVPAVWTGSEMIVWSTGAGAAFNPATNTWRSLSGAQAPSPRYGHSLSWTGEELIVWGGQISGQPEFNDGARYNPQLDRWTALPNAPLPKALSRHTAVWTGDRMLVWGGEWEDGAGSYLANDGFSYDPATKVWTEFSATGAPLPRAGHTAIWTGQSMIVWGGYDYANRLRSGGVYEPDSSRWRPLPIPTDLTGRSGHTAVWTGSEMIIWGGESAEGTVNDGARYNPATQTWRPVSQVGAPSPRAFHTAVWTGREMIVWGGVLSGAQGNTDTGARYDPITDRWAPLSLEGAPRARDRHTAVWTGLEMIVWGGAGPCCYSALNDGGRYDPFTDSWIAVAINALAVARKSHTAIWTGQEMIAFGGADGAWQPVSGGVRYAPAINRWTALAATNAPSARINHSTVWTGQEMIVWGGSLGRPLSSGGVWRMGLKQTYLPLLVRTN